MKKFLLAIVVAFMGINMLAAEGVSAQELTPDQVAIKSAKGTGGSGLGVGIGGGLAAGLAVIGNGETAGVLHALVAAQLDRTQAQGAHLQAGGSQRPQPAHWNRRSQ